MEKNFFLENHTYFFHENIYIFFFNLVLLHLNNHRIQVMVGVTKNLNIYIYIYIYISMQHTSSIGSLIASPNYYSAVISGLHFDTLQIVLLQILTIWTYIYIFIYNTGNEIVICQLQNAKSNFPKLCKFYTRQKTKCKSGIFIQYIHLAETFALIFDSKIVFKKLFWLKLSIQPRTFKVNRVTIFIFSFCTGLVAQRNGPQLWEYQNTITSPKEFVNS